MAVDPLFAQWLQTTSDNVVGADAIAAARWGTSAVTTERVTGIATLAAAQTEADRQLAFFRRGPFAIDVHDFVGVDWLTALGEVVTLFNDELGYAAGVDVYVLEVEVDRGSGISSVTVLCPLRGAL